MDYIYLNTEPLLQIVSLPSLQLPLIDHDSSQDDGVPEREMTFYIYRARGVFCNDDWTHSTSDRKTRSIQASSQTSMAVTALEMGIRVLKLERTYLMKVLKSKCNKML